jgi:hypothetical protein
VVLDFPTVTNGRPNSEQRRPSVAALLQRTILVGHDDDDVYNNGGCSQVAREAHTLCVAARPGKTCNDETQ